MSEPRACRRPPRPSAAPRAAYAGGMGGSRDRLHRALSRRAACSVGMAGRRRRSRRCFLRRCSGSRALGLARRWPWPPAGRWRLGAAARRRRSSACCGPVASGSGSAIVELDLRSRAPACRSADAADRRLADHDRTSSAPALALAGIGYAWHTAEALREARERAARAEVAAGPRRARAAALAAPARTSSSTSSTRCSASSGATRRAPRRRSSGSASCCGSGPWVHQAGSDWVPLSREWEFVHELPRARADAPRRPAARRRSRRTPSALEVPVPPFALQPLVENAIVHARGAARRRGPRRASGAAVRRPALALGDATTGRARSEAESPRARASGLRLLQRAAGRALRGPCARRLRVVPPEEASRRSPRSPRGRGRAGARMSAPRASAP